MRKIFILERDYLIMEYDAEKKEIKLDKELSNLDQFVVKFCNLLDNYVIVSGYVSILLGRTRATEDVDLLVPELEKEEFKLLWDKIYSEGMECVNTDNMEEAFFLMKEFAIRFCKDGIAVPNIEFKIIKRKFDKYSLDNRIKVAIGKDSLFISPLELQIAYKLSLGIGENEKDLEDAKHLYEAFGEKLNKSELFKFIKELNVQKEFDKII
jgi:hypothetical protein